MKIATYNISSGGFNDYSSNSQIPQRLDSLKKVIKYIDADFITLVDTFRWKELFSDKDLEQIFGYSHTFHIDMDDIRVDKRIGIAVLTNIDEITFHNIRLKTRNCIKSQILTKNDTVDIFSMYLDDVSEEVRQTQIDSLFTNLNYHPTIVMGDMNCILKEEVEELRSGFSSFLKSNPEFTETEMYDKYCIPALNQIFKATVLENVKSHGFVEAINEGKRKPTSLTKLHSWNMEKPIFRVDHIFHTKDIQSSDFKVLDDEMFEYVSDHYPIVCNVDF